MRLLHAEVLFMQGRRFVFPTSILLVVGLGVMAPNCSQQSGKFVDAGDSGDFDANEASDSPLSFADVHNDGAACVNLQCQVEACEGGPSTSISGTVYAPNGTLPLYNAIVYVPNAPLDPIKEGVSCDQCGVLASGAPVAVALTDSQGHFKIDNAPSGTDIPLVIQVGKWRRQVTISNVNPCTDNPIGNKTQNDAGIPVENLTRLPRNRKEGDMPRIAITTGGCDHLACIMPKLGIDPAEYAAGPATASIAPKTAISFYSGGSADAPTGSPPATALWDNFNNLKQFDIAIFSCECHEPNDATSTSYTAVRQYLDAGGRIFTTDFMYVWYSHSPDKNLSSPPWQWPGGAPPGGTPETIDTTFTKGQALSDWLYYVGGIAPYSSQVIQQPPIKDSFPADPTYDNVWSINTKYGLEWAHSGPADAPAGSPQHPHIITMGMPSANAAAQQCGKAVHLDLHVTSQDIVDSTFPDKCSADMREPELVTTFFFFDIASCVQDDKQPPIIPH